VPCREPNPEKICIRDAVRDMSLELCPNNVNEGDCRQDTNSRQRTNKWSKHTKEREEHAQLNANELIYTHSTAEIKCRRQKKISSTVVWIEGSRLADTGEHG